MQFVKTINQQFILLLNLGGSTPARSEDRITEDGALRITEAGQQRITEGT